MNLSHREKLELAGNPQTKGPCIDEGELVSPICGCQGPIDDCDQEYTGSHNGIIRDNQKIRGSNQMSTESPIENPGEPPNSIWTTQRIQETCDKLSVCVSCFNKLLQHGYLNPSGITIEPPDLSPHENIPDDTETFSKKHDFLNQKSTAYTKTDIPIGKHPDGHLPPDKMPNNLILRASLDKLNNTVRTKLREVRELLTGKHICTIDHVTKLIDQALNNLYELHQEALDSLLTRNNSAPNSAPDSNTELPAPDSNTEF